MDSSALRRFGLSAAVFFGLVFGVALPWLFGAAWPAWPFVLAALFALPAVVWPPLLGPVHVTVTRVGKVLGRINLFVLLALVYYLLVVPTGLVRRALGADSMGRRFDASRKSYRVPSTPRESDHLESSF